ncbi:MAG: winged helix-turn-helix transcriptional regulator [archaeon]
MAKSLDSGIVELDSIDSKILHQLDLNARMPISLIAKRTSLSRMVVEYRINKMLELGVIRAFATQIDPAKFGLSSWKVYVRLHNTTAELENQIMDFLAANPQVWWVVKCYGQYNLLYSVVGESYYEFYKSLIDFHNRFGEYILEENINNHLEPEFSSRGYLSDENPVMVCKPFLVKPEKSDSDSIDFKILKVISVNARLSAVEIAKKTGLSPRVVDYRMKELIKKKVIVYFRLVLDVNKIGRDYYKGLVYLKNTNSKNMERLIGHLKLNKEITQWGKTVGPWQLEIESESRNFKEYNLTIEALLNKFSDLIVRIDTILMYKEYNPEYNFLAYLEKTSQQ